MGLGICIAILAVCVFVYYNNHGVMLTRYEHKKGIPQGFGGFQILQISDLHGDLSFFKTKRMLRMIAKVNPDLIVVTGDCIDNIHIRNKKEVFHFLNLLHKKYQMVAVTGNHEYMHKECFEVLQELEEQGIFFLHNESIEIKRGDDRILLYGFDDPYEIYGGNVPAKYCTPGEEFIEFIRNKVVLNLNEQTPIIFLSHRPEFFEEYCKAGADIVFSGHAHGGQWRLPMVKGVIAPDQGWFPQYTAGKYEKEGTTMYVSRGLGNSVVPLRLFNRPELVLVRLEKEEIKEINK